MMEDSRGVGGWLEIRISRIVLMYTIPAVAAWIAARIIGVFYLNIDDLVFPTAITTFFMMGLVIYYHRTRPHNDWENRDHKVMSRIRDRMEPRGDGLLTGVFLLIYFLLHPVVTLGIPGIVLSPELYVTIPFVAFSIGMMIGKGGVIYLRGVDTPHDASLHTGSVTFGVIALASTAPDGVYLLPLIPLVGATVWWFRSHTILGVMGGFGIGAISGLLLFIV